MIEAEKKEGGDYTYFTRFAHATGIPTVVGPQGHSFQWGGNWDEVLTRKDTVRAFYTSGDIFLQHVILAQYKIRFIVLGRLERKEYGEGVMGIAANLPVAARFGKDDDPNRVVICHNPLSS